jgi:hypothetical protein
VVPLQQPLTSDAPTRVIEAARMFDKQRGREENNVNKRKKQRRRPFGTRLPLKNFESIP